MVGNARDYLKLPQRKSPLSASIEELVDGGVVVESTATQLPVAEAIAEMIEAHVEAERADEVVEALDAGATGLCNLYSALEDMEEAAAAEPPAEGATEPAPFALDEQAVVLLNESVDQVLGTMGADQTEFPIVAEAEMFEADPVAATTASMESFAESIKAFWESVKAAMADAWNATVKAFEANFTVAGRLTKLITHLEQLKNGMGGVAVAPKIQLKESVMKKIAYEGQHTEHSLVAGLNAANTFVKDKLFGEYVNATKELYADLAKASKDDIAKMAEAAHGSEVPVGEGAQALLGKVETRIMAIANVDIIGGVSFHAKAHTGSGNPGGAFDPTRFSVPELRPTGKAVASGTDFQALNKAEIEAVLGAAKGLLTTILSKKESYKVLGEASAHFRSEMDTAMSKAEHMSEKFGRRIAFQVYMRIAGKSWSSPLRNACHHLLAVLGSALHVVSLSIHAHGKPVAA